MTEYTPTTDEVVMGKTHLGDNFWRDLTEEEIRRWLTAHDAEVAAIAWDAAVEETHGLGWLHDFAKSDALARNPYRKAES